MFWHHFSHTSVSIFVVLLLLITDICSAQPLMQGVTDLSPAGPVELTTNLNQPPSPIRLKTNMDHFPTNTVPWYLNGQWKALHTVKHLKPSMLIMTLWLNCPITVWIKAYSTLYYSIDGIISWMEPQLTLLFIIVSLLLKMEGTVKMMIVATEHSIIQVRHKQH